MGYVWESWGVSVCVLYVHMCLLYLICFYCAKHFVLHSTVCKRAIQIKSDWLKSVDVWVDCTLPLMVRENEWRVYVACDGLWPVCDLGFSMSWNRLQQTLVTQGSRIFLCSREFEAQVKYSGNTQQQSLEKLPCRSHYCCNFKQCLTSLTSQASWREKDDTAHDTSVTVRMMSYN